MNRNFLLALVETLPADAGIFSAGRQPGLPPPSLAERHFVALNTPDFGHKFVIYHVTRGDALPAAAHEPWLRRAHSHYAGSNVVPDPVMLVVEQLMLPASEFNRRVLNALLVSRDCTFGQIASWLGLDEQVVIAYQQLHWNVGNQSAAQIAQLVLPEGRFPTLRPDGMEEMTISQRLLVAAQLHGSREILWLAGISNDQTPPSLEQSLKEFEQSLVQNALQLARAGALNSKLAPGISHGKSLLSAKRNSEPVNPAKAGLQDFSLGDGILLSMPRTKEEAELRQAAAYEQFKDCEKLFRDQASK